MNIVSKMEHLDRTLNNLILCLNIVTDNGGDGHPWFLSFGSLLNFVRDRGKLEGDLDISMLYSDDCVVGIESALSQFNFKLESKIIDSATMRPLHLSFSPVDQSLCGDIHVDIFFWIKAGDIFYHTYDVNMEKPKNGIPKEYVFKGVPSELLTGSPWNEQWPGFNHIIKIPRYFGALLDEWYPGWTKKDPMFGQSKSRYIVRVKKVPDLANRDIVLPQLSKSSVEYDAFVEKYSQR